MSIITINVHPYVKQVLIHQFGEEPIFAAQNNIIGIMIRPILSDKSDNKRHIKGDLSENLDLLLPTRLHHLTHNKKYDSVLFIYDEDMIKLKHSLKKFVDYILINNILCLKHSGTPTMESIKKVYAIYKIDEDMIPLENMMALYKRHNNSLQIAFNKKNKKNDDLGGNNCP